MRFFGQKILSLTLFLVLLTFFCSFSRGDKAIVSPTDKLRKVAKEITAILDEYVKNPQGKREETLNKLMVIADQYFDWAEMAKRSLGRFWKQITPEEQNKFTSLFRDLLKNAYLGRIENYAGEKVVFKSEKSDGSYSVVTSKIIIPTKGTEVLVDYRLKNNGGNWMLYDVVVQGVSLVSNYRDQFNSILQGSSYDELVKRIQEKLAQDKTK